MSKPGFTALALVLVWSAGFGGALACSREAPAPRTTAAAATALDTPPPAGRLPEGATPLAYRLELEIVPTASTFSGHAHIDVELARAFDRIWLHADGLRLRRVEVRPVTAERGTGAKPTIATPRAVGDSGLVALELGHALGPGRVAIELDYSADFDRFLRGLYRVEHGGDAYAFTQFEATDARRAFPCFDEPRFKTPFDVVLKVPTGAVAISNTAVSSSKALGNGLSEVVFARTQKLPTYLVAFAVGPLDVVDAPLLAASGIRAQAVPLRGIAPRGRGKELAFALSETPKLVESLERYLGTAYPYEKLDLLAVPDFAAGAMENAGAITFRDTLLLVGDTAPEWQRRASIGVNAHELAHQWFGDLVTMPWWDDLWLNEAFATWMGARVVDEVHPEFKAEFSRVAQLDRAMDTDSKENARQIRQPIQSDHDIKNAFDSITYTKGGAVLAMFERYLGVEAFRKGVQIYLERHRFGSAATPDLLRALEDGSGKPVAAAFSSFLDHPGLPHVSAALSCPANAAPSVRLDQRRYAPLGSKLSRAARWQVPVCVRYGAAPSAARSDSAAPEHEQCTLLEAEQAELTLDTKACPAWIFPNADAQGYYRWSLDATALEQLLARGYGALGTGERLSLLFNADAGAHAGEVGFGALMQVTRRVAEEQARELLRAALGVLERLSDDVLGDAELPGYRRLVHALVARRTQTLGLFPGTQKEDGERKLLRPLLVNALAFEARDPALRAELERLGRARLGLGQDARLTRLPSELYESALAVAVQNGGAPVIEKAKAALGAASDGLERGRLLGGLSANRDPAASPGVLELALDPSLRTNERAGPLLGQIRERETREVAYQWLTEHFDALVERLGVDNALPLVGLAGAFCTREHAERARQFYTPRVEKLPGGPRTLRLALETVELCAAFADAVRASAHDYFTSNSIE